MSDTNDNHTLSDEDIERLIEQKYKTVFSEKLDRKVYTLIDWIDKEVFKQHKKLFGYTDIGWTVKHPKQLIRALVEAGIWIT
ncbi:MAG: hypothetical protein GPJ54_05195 [Candidatus Heimdallarchaeota archaeon]|nr:hypothetical protein [Candidatus Heimdallarchaeota archaeon]